MPLDASLKVRVTLYPVSVGETMKKQPIGLAALDSTWAGTGAGPEYDAPIYVHSASVVIVEPPNNDTQVAPLVIL